MKNVIGLFEGFRDLSLTVKIYFGAEIKFCKTQRGTDIYKWKQNEAVGDIYRDE